MRKEKTQREREKEWVLHDNFLFSNPPPPLSLIKPKGLGI
jgi:hypothetical protein